VYDNVESDEDIDAEMVRVSGEHLENLHTHHQFKQSEIDNLQQ